MFRDIAAAKRVLAMLSILPPTFKLNLSWNKLGSCMLREPDFWLDKITRELLDTRELRRLQQNKFALGR